MALINENERYCTKCGTEYEIRELENEGKVQFCPKCQTWHFPVFNTACIMIVVDKTSNKILLVKQYSKPHFILVAGYVNRGESAENTVRRELKEETNLEASEICFNKSFYFERSNSLMLNFTVYVDDISNMKTNSEIDCYDWFSFDEAVQNIKEGSLAKEFLVEFTNKQKRL